MTAPDRRRTGVAFFDLDHTLVDGDSDSSFIEYLHAKGAVPREILEDKEPINAAYMEGRPWQPAYRALIRRIYRDRPLDVTLDLAREHAKTHVLPMLFPGARELLELERRRRRAIVLLTTTNQVVTEPLLELLGMDALLSSRLEIRGSSFTGEVVGEFCTGPGKRIALEAFCKEHAIDPANCAMYGDGRSDMDALAAVGEPFAVHPNQELSEVAAKSGWPILSLTR